MSIVKSSTTEMIFHRRWNFYVPEIAFLRDEEVKYGYRRTGLDMEDNQRLLQSTRKAHLTLAKVIEYFHQGHKITLCDPRQGHEIANILTEHLQKWQTALGERFNLPGRQEDIDKVVDDLVKIDRFMVSLYQMYKRYIPEPIPSTRLEMWLSGKGRRNGFRLTNPRMQPSLPTPEETPTNDTYQSIAETLRESRFTRRQKGWY